MHHPYLFDEEPLVSPLGNDRINFVYAGRTHKEKGFDIFCLIADEVGSTVFEPAIDPIFTLAGGLRWVPREYSTGGNVSLADTALRLTRDHLTVHLKNASYLVMPYDASAYGRTKASGVLLDAASHVKPIIALRTDELSYYFELFGDLGILCESAAEMKHVVFDIIRNPPSIAYAEQQANLLTARDFFRVENQKAAFKSLWL
jgi:glycosyltransferase involved in cell wall biosynthesis